MNSELKTWDIETSISVDNVKAQFEEFLRRYRYIGNNQELTELSIGNVKQGFDIKGNKTDVLPLRYKLKREEVEVIKHW